MVRVTKQPKKEASGLKRKRSSLRGDTPAVTLRNNRFAIFCVIEIFQLESLSRQMGGGQTTGVQYGLRKETTEKQQDSCASLTPPDTAICRFSASKLPNNIDLVAYITKERKVVRDSSSQIFLGGRLILASAFTL